MKLALHATLSICAFAMVLTGCQTTFPQIIRPLPANRVLQAQTVTRPISIFETTDQEQAKQVFKMIDANNDGFFTFPELVTWVETVSGQPASQAALKKSFNRLDSNKDAKISFEEYWKNGGLGRLPQTNWQAD